MYHFNTLTIRPPRFANQQGVTTHGGSKSIHHNGITSSQYGFTHGLGPRRFLNILRSRSADTIIDDNHRKIIVNNDDDQEQEEGNAAAVDEFYQEIERSGSGTLRMMKRLSSTNSYDKQREQISKQRAMELSDLYEHCETKNTELNRMGFTDLPQKEQKKQIEQEVHVTATGPSPKPKYTPKLSSSFGGGIAIGFNQAKAKQIAHDFTKQQKDHLEAKKQDPLLKPHERRQLVLLQQQQHKPIQASDNVDDDTMRKNRSIMAALQRRGQILKMRSMSHDSVGSGISSGSASFSSALMIGSSSSSSSTSSSWEHVVTPATMDDTTLFGELEKNVNPPPKHIAMLVEASNDHCSKTTNNNGGDGGYQAINGIVYNVPNLC